MQRGGVLVAKNAAEGEATSHCMVASWWYVGERYLYDVGYWVTKKCL